MKNILAGFTLFITLTGAASCLAADFTLSERLGHSWTNERVSFPLNPIQSGLAAGNRALLDSAGRTVAYQVATGGEGQQARIFFQADLSAYQQREYEFSDLDANTETDLEITESNDEIRIENDLIGLLLRKKLKRGQGPLAGVRLAGGHWTGESSLTGSASVQNYSAQITASGAVFVEVLCKLDFSGGGSWSLRFRIENNEPVVLVDEHFDAPRGGMFKLSLGDKNYRPTHILFRHGQGGNLAKVSSEEIGSGKVFLLEPWLHWWQEDRQGNWFALYSDRGGDQQIPLDSDTRSDMLMIGLLRPSVWKDPDWSGQAGHAELEIPARVAGGQVQVSFPLGGGRRIWMLGTPDRNKSISVLAEKNRKVSPLPQQYLIKHGDFPLDQVKNHVLEWETEPDSHPRLFMGNEDMQALRHSLVSDAKEVNRWENKQAINKYNIDAPLREYFASGSAKLGEKIVKTSIEWLDSVVLEDLLLQNSRVTLGVAPHGQAVLLLPTINLTDTALAAESLTPETRWQILARLAFLAYVVNSDDYWSPARGFEANPNMTTTVAHYQVALASLIPSHPLAKQWAKKGLDTLYSQLMDWSDEDGGWLEAPHYALVAFDHMLAAFMMAERAGFADYLYADRVKKIAQWLAQISTPPDVHTNGFRHLPPIGNTYYGEASGVFCIVAGLWWQRDAEFAGQMQWMCEQHGTTALGLGWSFPSMAGYKDLIRPKGISATQPDYGSAWFRQTGVVLRNQIGSGRETWLHLIAGSNHEHYDKDSGSVVIWGKGQVLADDWGYIGQHAKEYHNMLTSLTTFGNMRIEAFSTQPSFDYVSGRKGSWQRQIALVKDDDPLGPNFFLIKDTNHLGIPAKWRMWLSTARPVSIQPTGATVTGQGDVDFDLFFYQAEKLRLKTESETLDIRVGNRNGKAGPMKLQQTALMASLRGQGSITVLIYPRLRTEASPNVIWHADGEIVEVVSSSGSDYVFLSFSGKKSGVEYKTQNGHISFKGEAASIQVREALTTLNLGSGGSVRLNDKSLDAAAASFLPFPN
jgi:hypothetical protein